MPGQAKREGGWPGPGAPAAAARRRSYFAGQNGQADNSYEDQQAGPKIAQNDNNSTDGSEDVENVSKVRFHKLFSFGMVVSV